MFVVIDCCIFDLFVDQCLLLMQLLLVGFQYVLLMYGGVVVVFLIVGQVVGFLCEEIVFLINVDLLVVGIVILVQLLGIGLMGICMLVMMGVSFVVVGSMVVMVGMFGVGIIGIFGVIIVVGFFGMFIVFFMLCIVCFFLLLVIGMVIILIGMCLFLVVINWVGGGKGVEDFGFLYFLFFFSLVFCIIFLINCFMCGFWVNILVLMGMGLGYVIVGGMGMVDFGGLVECFWFDIVILLYFGVLIFDLVLILFMCLVVVIIFVEFIGMFFVLGKIIGCEIILIELCCGLFCDVGVLFFVGFLNIFIYFLFVQNIGLVQMIGVCSCYVMVVVVGFLIFFSMLFKVVFLVVLILLVVFGGVGIVMFGMVVVSGIQIFYEVNIIDCCNQLLVVVSIGMGMVLVVCLDFFVCLLVWMELIIYSGIVMIVIWVVVLNLLFNIFSCNDCSYLCGSYVLVFKYF